MQNSFFFILQNSVRLKELNALILPFFSSFYAFLLFFSSFSPSTLFFSRSIVRQGALLNRTKKPQRSVISILLDASRLCSSSVVGHLKIVASRIKVSKTESEMSSSPLLCVIFLFLSILSDDRAGVERARPRGRGLNFRGNPPR